MGSFAPRAPARVISHRAKSCGAHAVAGRFPESFSSPHARARSDGRHLRSGGGGGRHAAMLAPCGASASVNGRGKHDPGPVRHPRHRHDAQPGGARLHADPRLPRRRRDQARGAEGRRHRAHQHARPEGQRQPVLPDAQRQQAQPDAEPEDRRGQGAVPAGDRPVRRAGGELRAGRARPPGARLQGARRRSTRG